MMESKTTQETLVVQKPITLCFEHCCDKRIPMTKDTIKRVVETLRCFSDPQKMESRRPHFLKPKGKDKWLDDCINHSAGDVKSLDVGHAGGKLGNFRLIYYTDPNNSCVAKVLSLFYDDH